LFSLVCGAFGLDNGFFWGFWGIILQVIDYAVVTLGWLDEASSLLRGSLFMDGY
jgi:hypothetical protein